MSQIEEPSLTRNVRNEVAPFQYLHFDLIWKKMAVYMIGYAGACVVGFPLFWMLLCSFKGRTELYASPPTFWPTQWTLENYVDLFIQTKFGTYFLNSIIVGVGTTVFSIAVGSLAAYSVTRFRFWGLPTISRSVLLLYMLPEVLIVIPMYSIIVNAGLQDTLFALIISNTAFTLPLAVWFMRSYFLSIPVNLEESAMIDGCSRFGALRRVVLPLALPGLLSVSVFSFNHAWNEFLFALVFTSSEDVKVLPLGLSTWIGENDMYSWGMLLAAGVLVTLPVMIFYLIAQRNLVVGATDGGVKGA
ncbi:carbohydrate ABC transporter permease [Rhizobium mayense]|uniref:Carbohydrate ABC transporter permease n=1 Tax=Rhizobium mayense TaxID=1312184 RepID=A0ABT7JRH1_9HYPH|nr:carbohydrate ABC transporter permease [Rhizobium mayense]MDL2398941.1 carbohydrate ABC transporter permease [Rhizobium mayense]